MYLKRKLGRRRSGVDKHRIRGRKFFEKYIEKELYNSEAFDNHCFETAQQLNISKNIVKDVLMEFAIETLCTLEFKVMSGARIKILVRGTFSFQTISFKDNKH